MHYLGSEAAYQLLDDPRCGNGESLSHKEARQLKKEGKLDVIIFRMLRLAYVMAWKKHRQYNYKTEIDELIAICFLRLVELVHTWKPRKQTFKSYIILGLRNSTWEEAQTWRKRSKLKALGLMERNVHMRLQLKKGPERGCLAEVEAVIYKVLDDDLALFFCRRYGLCGSRVHSYKELMELYNIPARPYVHRKIQQAVQQLHNYFNNEDWVSLRELAWRTAGNRARKAKPKRKLDTELNQSRGAKATRKYYRKNRDKINAKRKANNWGRKKLTESDSGTPKSDSH